VLRAPVSGTLENNVKLGEESKWFVCLSILANSHVSNAMENIYIKKIKNKWYLYIYFITTFYNYIFHTYIIFFSLFSFLSLLFFTNKKRIKGSCHKNCLKWLFKYHYSKQKYLLFHVFLILRPSKFSPYLILIAF